ncbi:MAG TPA: universal stress protein [Chitinophagaceae bacterium]|nr:universal stress protein [Chitinophagaceae bacterium]
MKRILVSNDFSLTAEKAFRFALNIAAKARGTIILYHVYAPVESVFIETTGKRKMFNTQTETNVIKRLQRLKKKVTDDSTEVPVSTIVGRTPLIDNILGFALQNHIDLIVMGTQRTNRLKKIIVGSVAARIEKSDLPVLLVPEKYKIEKMKQFVYASNYQPSDKQVMTLVNAMTKLYDVNVTALHLTNAYMPDTRKEKERNDFGTYAFSLQQEFSQPNLNFHLLGIPSVAETMETLYKTLPYDIMTMIRQKKFPGKVLFSKFHPKYGLCNNKTIADTTGRKMNPFNESKNEYYERIYPSLCYDKSYPSATGRR